MKKYADEKMNRVELQVGRGKKMWVVKNLCRLHGISSERGEIKKRGCELDRGKE